MFVCEFETHSTPTEGCHPESSRIHVHRSVSVSLTFAGWESLVMAPWKLRQLHHQSCHHATTSSTQFRWVTYTPPNDPSFHHFIIIVSGWKDVDISPTWVTWNTVASCVPNLKTPKVLDEVATAIIHPDCKHLQSGFATCPALTSLKIAFFLNPFEATEKWCLKDHPPKGIGVFPPILSLSRDWWKFRASEP